MLPPCGVGALMDGSTFGGQITPLVRPSLSLRFWFEGPCAVFEQAFGSATGVCAKAAGSVVAPAMNSSGKQNRGSVAIKQQRLERDGVPGWSPRPWAAGNERQARLTTPASPLSVPKASSMPSALQASAVTGATPGLLAKISAPSSRRTRSTMPSL